MTLCPPAFAAGSQSCIVCKPRLAKAMSRAGRRHPATLSCDHPRLSRTA